MEGNPIQELYDEHSGILIMLEILDRVSVKLTNGDDVAKEDLVDMAEFLSNFADTCHHGKEEGILVPEMKKFVGSDIHLINEIIGEHKTGRELIAGIRGALPSYMPDSIDAHHIAANLKAYIAMLMEHIRRENVILFPQAKELLTDESRHGVGERFAQLEHNVIGPGKHEEYHALLETLRRKYL